MELEVCKRNGHRFQPWAPRSLPSRRGSRSTSGSSAGAQSLELDVLTDRHLRGAEAFRLAFLVPCELKQVYAALGSTLGKFHNGPDFRLPMPARYVVDQDGRIRAAESSGEIKPGMNDEGSVDTAAANPFGLPRLHPARGL